MIIDSHCHLKHGDPARTEYTPEEIVETMDRAGIDRSVVFAMSTTTQRSIEMAQQAVELYPDRLIPYAYALPSYERPALADLDHAVTQLGFRGIKVHAGECTLAGYVADPLMELAGQRRVPCLIDCKGYTGDVERLAGKFPGTSIIIAHLGQYLCTSGQLIDRFIQIAEAHANVYLDISGVVLPWKAEEAVRRIGSARVIFGIDGPHKQPDTVSFAKMELKKVEMLDLTAQQEQDLLGGTIARLLNIGS
jgi:hypothetical protein